jgi:hypothetical protein
MSKDVRHRPRFPVGVISGFFAVFCAFAALSGIWLLPIGLAPKIAVTEVFGLVPLGIVLFWAGRWFERSMSHRAGASSSERSSNV